MCTAVHVGRVNWCVHDRSTRQYRPETVGDNFYFDFLSANGWFRRSTQEGQQEKQQWDRYLALKTSEGFAVAVSVVDLTSTPTPTSDSQIEWLQVGIVRSKGNAFTEEAVMRQRLLIAEHARRVYPLKVLAKDTLDWAYLNKDDQLVVVGKSLFGKVKMPADIEKMIGFVGLPDKSGFYMRSSEGLIDNAVTKRVTKA
jgi:hypothetical protein